MSEAATHHMVIFTSFIDSASNEDRPGGDAEGRPWQRLTHGFLLG